MSSLRVWWGMKIYCLAHSMACGCFISKCVKLLLCLFDCFWFFSSSESKKKLKSKNSRFPAWKRQSYTWKSHCCDYIQQRVWHVTRSHDLWHVLPTLKRIITKSTLYLGWRYHILVHTLLMYCTGCMCDFNTPPRCAACRALQQIRC